MPVAAKFRMSRAMKPRKSAPLPGWAPWPRIATTGPWFDGLSSGLALLNALPADGSVRSAVFVSVPRQAVSAVAKKSMNWLWLSGHGLAAPALRAGQVDVAADRDRQDVAHARGPSPAADRVLVEPDQPAERVVDRVLDGDPDLAAVDEDPVDQVVRVAGVADLVDGARRRLGRRRARRASG